MNNGGVLRKLHARVYNGVYGDLLSVLVLSAVRIGAALEKGLGHGLLGAQMKRLFIVPIFQFWVCVML